MYQHPKLLEPMVRDRAAELLRDGTSRRSGRRGERPVAVRSAGWLLVDLGLRLALPRASDRGRTLISE